MPSRPNRIPAPQKAARRSLGTARRRTQAERTEETRTRILKAASELIRRRGYARFRTADVAAEAGLSRGAQLHHFPTKDSLVARLQEYQAAERNGLVYVSLDRDPIFPIPAFPEFDDPTYRVAVVPGYDWRTGAARRTENFVDFAHFAWVHDGVLASRDDPEVPEHEVWRDGAELRTTITVEEPASTDKTETLELESADASVPGRRNYRVALPFTVWLQQQLPRGNTFVLFMACSPISRNHCRSFTFNARTFALEEDDERFIKFQQEIAEADRVISESQTPEELPFDMTAELYVRGVDRLSIEYRRWLFEVARATTDG